MRGKLIVIEGTDCSGKRTQTEMLVERLKKENINVEKLHFPRYDTPTGKIIGGPYLGKKYISEGWFPEGAINVDPKVAALYYAADRRYCLPIIQEALSKNDIVFLDRYTTSNMGHQGGKLKTIEERSAMFEWIHKLEYDLLELPVPDLSLLLYMPYDKADQLKQFRSISEAPDQHESSEEHLRDAEKAYLELAVKYNWQTIDCIQDDKIKTIEEIHEEVYKIVKDYLN